MLLLMVCLLVCILTPQSVLNAARSSQLERLVEAVKPLDMAGSDDSMKVRDSCIEN
jgi:hypothetical protein